MAVALDAARSPEPVAGCGQELQNLVARHNGLMQRLRANRKEQRSLNDRKKRRPWSVARQEYRRPFEMELGCGIWCLSRDREDLVAFATRTDRRVPGLAESLIRTCEDMSEDAIRERLAATDGRRRRARVRAIRILRECRLHAWVLQQNRCKGLAPTMSAVWLYAREAVRRELPGAPAIPEDTAEIRPHSRFNKLRRWRHRFHIRRGRFPVGEALAPAALEGKARGREG